MIMGRFVISNDGNDYIPQDKCIKNECLTEQINNLQNRVKEESCQFLECADKSIIYSEKNIF